jgi:hypothetical protein
MELSAAYGINTNVKWLLCFAALLAFAACSTHAAVTTPPTLLVAAATAKPGATVMAHDQREDHRATGRRAEGPLHRAARQDD